MTCFGTSEKYRAGSKDYYRTAYQGALGYTLQTPEEEKYLETKDELLAKITTFMAGRAAEVLVFHSATSGAANDIENEQRLRVPWSPCMVCQIRLA